MVQGFVGRSGRAWREVGLLRLAADRVGLISALSVALTRSGFWPVHDRGRVLADLAVAIADDATTISAIDTLRDQGELFGSVAADTTVWWALEEVTPGQLGRIVAARAQVVAPDRARAQREAVGRTHVKDVWVSSVDRLV